MFGRNLISQTVSSLAEIALEQHHRDWNSRGDKGARSNKEIERTDCSSQADGAQERNAGSIHPSRIST